MTEPSYPARDATQGAFSFGASGFHINETFRERGQNLRRLLFPESLKSKKARMSALNDASVISIPWIKAQLQYYGIDFSADTDPFKAKALLLTSVAHGLVSTSVLRDSVASSIITNSSVVRCSPTPNSSN